MRAWLEHIALRVVFMIMQAFPIDWNLRTARLLARIWPWIMPRHRQRAITNLAASYGKTLTPAQIELIADRCLESVTMFAVEAICLPRLINRFTWPRYIKPVNFQETLDLLMGGKGLILVTGHYGSFELVGHLLANLGFNMTAVMRPLDNAYINDFLVNARRTHGLTLLDKKGATADAERILTNGGTLGFIGDQDAGRKGLFVDFFGRPASTYKSIGLLAMTAQCPIVVGYARRQGKVAQYEVGVQRVIHPHEWETQEDPLRWITEAYSRAIEAFVRDEPEQYLWIHRRWKSEPGRKRKPKRAPSDSMVAGRTGAIQSEPRP